MRSEDPISGGLKNPDGRIRRDIAMLYKKDIEDWDVEELARGRPRSADGTFKGGGHPKWLTPVVVAEAKRRLLQQTYGKLAVHLDTAVKTVYDLMVSDEIDEKGRPIVDARTKLAAAQFIIEHFLGKPTQFVEAEVNDITKSAIAAAIVLDDGDGQDHFVLEGELVDDEEEDEDGE
jgi:hypothetical protein